jgi:hypothetical protein
MCLFLNIACTDEGPIDDFDFSPKDPVIDDKVRDAVDSGLATIDMDEILSKEYYLKAPLGFSDNDYFDTKVGEGTSIERTLRIFSKVFQEQQEVAVLDLVASESSCSVLVEADDTISADDIEFEMGQLRKGQVSQSNGSNLKDGEVTHHLNFRIQFQAGFLRSFFLNCKNVVNSEGIAKHVGHLLEVRDASTEETTSMNDIEPSNFSAQYIADPTDPDFPSINHVITIDKDDLPEDENFELALNIYKTSFHGSKELIAGPIPVHRESGQVLGPLVLNFNFSNDDLFSTRVINEMRLMEYEFVSSSGSGFRIKLGEMCDTHKDSILNMSFNSPHCPTHIPEGIMPKTMFTATKSCDDSDFEYSKINGISSTQKQGGQRGGSQCDRLIWDLVEEGLTDQQVNYLFKFTNSSVPSDDCKNFRSNSYYSALRRAEGQDAIVMGHDKVDAVPDQVLYELCLSQQSQ